MKSLRIIVNGKVQGVFFRASARDVAEALSIKGFAKNQSDGSVYIEAEGAEEKLEQFIDWCLHGPPRAQVIHVDVQESHVKNFEKFEVRR